MKLKILNKNPFNINLEEAKLFMRVDIDVEDNLIEGFLEAALIQAEAITNRAFSLTKYALFLDDLKTVELPRAPFVELVSVEILENNSYKPFDFYEIDENDLLAKVIIKNGYKCEHNNCLKIVFKAGYENIPKDVKTWVYTKAATMYEYRTEFADERANKINNKFLDSLLDKYKIRTFL